MIRPFQSICAAIALTSLFDSGASAGPRYCVQALIWTDIKLKVFMARHLELESIAGSSKDLLLDWTEIGRSDQRAYCQKAKRWSELASVLSVDLAQISAAYRRHLDLTCVEADTIGGEDIVETLAEYAKVLAAEATEMKAAATSNSCGN